jgi:hypothetical protein
MSGGDLQNSSTIDWGCFPDGVYELSACDYDSGDGWMDDWYVDICVNSSGNDNCAYVNGYNMTYDADGYGCDSDIFAVNMWIGCMDSEAMNFNPYADYEPEGSCIYPCPEESFILMQENPWGGIDGDETWEITNDDTGEVVLSGNVESGYDCDYYYYWMMS